jgi:hypothetical protein
MFRGSRVVGSRFERENLARVLNSNARRTPEPASREPATQIS